MKALLVTALLALSFTTGFTCSKNAQEAAAPAEQAQPTAEAAAQPAADAAAAPTEAAQPAADAAAAQPAATENK